jgi:DNA invertase Pin-like site-specific DNA recombinase
MLEKPRVAIYARVSTDEQNVDNQVDQLKTWVASRGWEIVAIYQESESAWKAGHQAELAHLKSDAAKRKFDSVLVWALDRLSREGALAILQLVTTLKIYGVKVISYQESWTEAPGELAEVLYAIAGWVARMESQRRSERTKAGLNRLKANGKVLGRPPGSKDKRKRKKVRQIPKLQTYGCRCLAKMSVFIVQRFCQSTTSAKA